MIAVKPELCAQSPSDIIPRSRVSWACQLFLSRSCRDLDRSDMPQLEAKRDGAVEQELLLRA